MDTPIFPWPPEFTLKKSARARRVKLTVSVSHGLQLVTPMRFNQKHIPEILFENRAWIEKQLAQIAEKLQAIQTQALPEEIDLPALNQHWKIIYAKNTNKKIRILPRANHELVLLGNIEDKELCKKMLTQWTRGQAKIYLPIRLQQWSEQMGLTYQSVTIRNQRSRWGSCTAQKAINLNYKLIFMPPEMLDYIIIHELSHTVHLNHSAKFWRLVASWDAQWKEHSRIARRGEKFIPLWVVD